MPKEPGPQVVALQSIAKSLESCAESLQLIARQVSATQSAKDGPTPGPLEQLSNLLSNTVTSALGAAGEPPPDKKGT